MKKHFKLVLLLCLLCCYTFVAKQSRGAIFLDNGATGCANGATNYDDNTRSCGSGIHTVYDNLADFSNNLAAGGENYIRAGTYTRTTNSNEGSLSINIGGTAGQHTVISAYMGEELQVIIGTDPNKLQYNPDPSQGADGNTALSAMYYPNPAVNIAASYVTLKGIKTYGMLTVTGVHDVLVEGNDFGGGGPGTLGGTYGQGQTIIITTSYDITIRSNSIHHSCRATDGLPGHQNGPALMGYDFSATIENNEFYDGWHAGIRLKDTGNQQGRNITIRYNFFRPSTIFSSSGIGIEGIGQDGDVDYILIYNNIFYEKNIGIEWDIPAAIQTIAHNNTFVNCGVDINTWMNGEVNVFNNLYYHSFSAQRFYDIQANPISTQLYSDYNLFYSSGGDTVWRNLYINRGTTLLQWQTYSGKDGNSVSKDPGFVNPTGSNPEDFKRLDYSGDVLGSPYGIVAGAYQTGNETIGRLDTTPTASSTNTETPVVSLRGQKIIAYPNPAQDKVTFQFEPQARHQIEIRIFNVAGKLVTKVSGFISPSEQQLEWDTSKLAAGVYIYQVYQAGKLSASGKVCKLK